MLKHKARNIKVRENTLKVADFNYKYLANP